MKERATEVERILFVHEPFNMFRDPLLKSSAEFSRNDPNQLDFSTTGLCRLFSGLSVDALSYSISEIFAIFAKLKRNYPTVLEDLIKIEAFQEFSPFPTLSKLTITEILDFIY